MKEEWRPIPGYTGYEASNKGRVRSYRKTGRPKRHQRAELIDEPHILKQHSSPHGKYSYPSVLLVGKKRLMFRSVAHLVMTAFDNPRLSKKHHIIYKDGNKENCQLENLEWVPYRKLTTKEVIKIVKTYRKGQKSRLGGISMKKLAEQYDVSSSTIRNIIQGSKKSEKAKS